MHRIIITVLFFVLLLGPVLITHGLNSPVLTIPRSGNIPSSSPPQVSPVPVHAQLLSGEVKLVSSVNVRNLPLANPSRASGGTVAIGTPVPQTSSAVVTLVLAGASGSAPNPCGCYPPDPNNAVGPNHVFEMVNLAGIIYLKNGTVAKSTFSLYDFFQISTSISLSDPEILYDMISGRWFAALVDVTDDSVPIAVSTTSDPTGAWTLYTVSASPYFPDQPYIGTSDDKFVITANDFISTTFVGTQYWILNKAELLNASSTIDFSTNGPDSSMHTLRPVRHLTTTAQFYLVTNCIGSCVTDTMTSMTNTVEILTVSGVPPGTVSVTTQTLSISTSVQPPNAPQPGCPDPLSGCALVTNDNAILSAVWESGTLWLAWADSCTPNGDTVTRSCLRLVEAALSGTGAATKSQDFDYGSNGEYLFYPAISLYHGQLVVVYGKSSTSVYPSLYVTGRLPSDPANTLQTPALIQTGTALNTGNPPRYGDYFGAGTDPLPTFNSTFWVSGEYRTSSTDFNWATAIARVAAFGPDFSVSAIPSSMIILAGRTSNSTITVLGNKFTGTVSLGVAVSPSGLSCSLNPTTVTLGSSASSKLSCTGSSGSYNVTVTGSSGVLSHSARIGVRVVDFAVATSPTVIQLLAGQSGRSNITVTSINHFTGNVTLSGTASSGLTFSISPTRIAGSGIATLTVSSNTAANYTLTIKGVSGSLSHTVTMTVRVTDFTVSATPSSTTVSQGNPVNVTVTLVGSNRFSGIVSFTMSSSPPGLPFSPSSTSITLPIGATRSFNITVSPTNSTSPQQYSLNITGTSSSRSHSIVVLVNVQSEPVGGTVIPINRVELLLPYFEAGIVMVTVLSLGALLLGRAKTREFGSY